MRAALLAALILGATAAHTKTITPVSVLYAGSLVTPMQGPIKAALQNAGLDFQGEPGGSRKLAHFIAAGLRSPDVFVSVDPKLVTGLGSKVASAVTFASTSLGIGWSDKSPSATLFASLAKGKETIVAALETKGLHIARTDRRIDPKGEYTIEGMKMLAGSTKEKQILGADQNPAQIFPEEDLLTRIDTGEADVGFFYKTEAVARGLHFIPLPGAASLSNKITYTLAIIKNPPHPAQAKAFATFLLAGKGKAILQKAGIAYAAHPRKL